MPVVMGERLTGNKGVTGKYMRVHVNPGNLAFTVIAKYAVWNAKKLV